MLKINEFTRIDMIRVIEASIKKPVVPFDMDRARALADQMRATTSKTLTFMDIPSEAEEIEFEAIFD